RHQGRSAAIAIRNHAENNPSRGSREERNRTERSRHRQREMKLRILDQRGENQREEHYVERVEHPAERSGDECFPRAPVRRPPPIEQFHGHGAVTGLTSTPASSNPLRMAAARAPEPGVSLCTQIVSA